MAQVPRVSVFAVLVSLAFWAGYEWRRATDRRAAEAHAQWIARYWREGENFDAFRSELLDAMPVRLVYEEWVFGVEGDLARGPIVGGQRLCIRSDRSIYWRVAR